MTTGADLVACTGAGMGMWWPLGAVFSILFWGLLIWGGITLARRAGVFSAPRRAEEALAERYASGDIEEDEYRRRLATLHGRSYTEDRV